MIIKNAQVFGEDGQFLLRDLYIENHKIVGTLEEVSDRTELDAGGCRLIPGLVDVHSHGAAGHDFSDGDEEGLREILRYQRSQGVTTYCPTSMTLPKERLLEIFSVVKDWVQEQGEARLGGINMEGPFIEAGKKGAHVAAHIVPPDPGFFRECNEAGGGKIRLVTLAPDVPGSEDFIREVKDEVRISLGHTAADYDTAKRAFELGAGQVTHLFNAMPVFGHREPGVVGAAADSPGCMAEIISDGYHIHPSAVRAAFRLFGGERMILISDSMRAAGMADGEYELGGQKVLVNAGRATLENGTLAGSATSLLGCMKKAISFGVPAAEAIFAATRNPARSIGMYDRVGSLTPGKEADVLILDEEWNLRQVI